MVNWRIWYLVGTFLTPLPGWAESSVWVAEWKGETVYLGGTCHMLRASDFPLPAEFDAAYAAVDVLYFETDIARLQSPEVQGVLLGLGMLIDGSTLQDHLDTDTWRALVDHCRRLDLPLAVVERMRPWMATVTLAVLEWQRNGAVQDGVDLHYHRLAGREGKASHGLEDVDRHLGYLTSLGQGREDEMVRATLADLEEAPAKVDELVAAWRRGDLAFFDREMTDSMRRDFPEVYEVLVTGRNRAWVPRILELFDSSEREWVLVGVGHFGGEAGLLALLRAEGVSVEPLAIEQPAPAGN